MSKAEAARGAGHAGKLHDNFLPIKTPDATRAEVQEAY